MKNITLELLFEAIYNSIQIAKYFIILIKTVVHSVKKYMCFTVYLYANKRYTIALKRTRNRICNILRVYS